MHYLVKLIVPGESHQEALDNAERDAVRLTEVGDFDWYNLNGRWGPSTAHSVKSKEGNRLIAEGMEDNRNEFDEGLKAVKFMLDNYSDDEIYNERFVKDQDVPYYLSRYQFGRVGGYTTASRIYALDGSIWGGKVEHDKDLRLILDSQGSEKLWVVAVDFHN